MSRYMLMAVLLSCLGTGWAQVRPDTLTVFKAGDTARAAAVNANFKVLWDRMNSLAAENQALVKKVDSLKNAGPRPGADSSSRMPIGTILASVLPPKEFEAAFGTKIWLLADGGRTDAPEFLAAFGTDRLPDLRGVFLRGMNLGRSDEFSDPSGTRTAGSVQGDATSLPNSQFILSSDGDHSHTLDLETTASRNFDAQGARVSWNTVASPGLQTSPTPNLSNSGEHSHSLSGGDAETRPKNAAVYYYIKVR